MRKTIKFDRILILNCKLKNMSGLNPNLPSLPTQQEVKILPNTLISQLDPIEKNRNIIPLNRDMLVELVEFPLLKPCQMLWDKGIRTMIEYN